MTKQTATLLLIFSCLLSNILAQSNYAALLHKPYEQRCRLLDSLFYPVTSNFDKATFAQQLEQVAALARREGDEELSLEMQYRRLRFVAPRFPSAATEKEIQQLVQQAKERHYQQLETRAKILLALRQHVAYGNIWASMELYLDARQLIQQMPVARFPDKRDYLYHDLANIYYDLEDYENAKLTLLEAISLPFYPVPFPVKVGSLINVNNTLGLVYREQARYDSAIFYFEQAHKVAWQQRDSAWLGITSGNIGITLFLQKRYREAVPLLQNDVQLSIRAGEYSNAANSLLKLAEINEAQGNRPMAYRQMTQARILLQTNPRVKEHYTRLNSYYLLMGRLLNAGGTTPAAAYRYADSALQIQDTLFRQKREVILARAQQKTDNEHLKLEVEKLESHQRIQALLRNGLLCLLVLSVIITGLLISRQRLLKKQQQFAEIRRQMAQKELEAARAELQHFTTNIREKNELIERLTTEMVDLQTNLSNEAIDYRQTTLEQLRRQTILTEEEWEVFRTSFEKVYPGWFEGIGNKLPGLSAADLRFMALSKLKLRTREMSAVLGISPGSVRMSRHRIRKKYSLTDEESLELLAGEV